MTNGYLPDQQTTPQTFSDKIISFSEIIDRAKNLGVDFGNGDPYNRLRYYTKIGLLPHAVRRSFNGQAPTGAYPEKVLGLILEIDKKLQAGQTVQAILKEKTTEKFAPKTLVSSETEISEPKVTLPTPVTLLPVFKAAPKAPELNLPKEPELVFPEQNLAAKPKSKFGSRLINLALVLFIILIIPTTIYLIGNHQDSFGLNQRAKVTVNPKLPNASVGQVLASTISPFFNVNVEAGFKELVRTEKGIGFSSNNFTSYFNTTTLTADRNITLPNQSGTLCLSSGNCSGSGGGVTVSASGTAGAIALFTGNQTIANSIITQTGSGITIGGGLTVNSLAAASTVNLCLNGNQLAACTQASTFTPGSVIFADSSGLLSQDNTNFFWNDTTNRLGLGTNSPSATLDIRTAETTGNLVNIAASGTPTQTGTINGLGVDLSGFIPSGFNRNGLNIAAITGGVTGDTGFKVGSGWDFGFDVSSKSRIVYQLRQNTSDSALLVQNTIGTADSSGSNIHNLLELAPTLFTPTGGTSYLNAIKIDDVVQNDTLIQAGIRIGTGWKNAILINQDPLNPSASTNISSVSESVIGVRGNYHKDIALASVYGMDYTPTVDINITPCALCGDTFFRGAPTYNLNGSGVDIPTQTTSIFTLPTFNITGTNTGAHTISSYNSFISGLNFHVADKDGSDSLTIDSVSHFNVAGGSIFFDSGITSRVTINNLYGLYVSDNIPFDNGGGVGVLSNQYGVYVQNLTGGTKDYGVYVAGADTAGVYAAAGTSNSSTTKVVSLDNQSSNFTGNFLDIQGQGERLESELEFDGVATYTDHTTEANSPNGTVYQLLADTDDVSYFGNSTTFSNLWFDLSTPATGATLVWEYCSANASVNTPCDTWTAVGQTVNSIGNFTSDGEIAWTDPTSISWIRSREFAAINYYLRVRSTTVPSVAPTAFYSTPSIASSGNLIKVANGNNTILGLDNVGALTLAPINTNVTPLSISAPSSNSSTTRAITINSISSGSGVETAISIGTGWDNILAGSFGNLTSASATGVGITNGSTTTSGTVSSFAATLGVTNASTAQDGLLITPSGSASAGTLTGVNIGALSSAGGTTSNEVGVKVGSGWDYGIWSSSLARFDANIELTGSLPSPDTSEVICRNSTNLLASCSSEAGTDGAFVHLAPQDGGGSATPDIETTTRTSIWINKTGVSGDLIRLCTGATCATDKFKVDFDGNETIAGSLTSSASSLVLGNATIDLPSAATSKTLNVCNNASDCTLTIQNSGAGSADLSLEGDLLVSGGNVNFGATTTIGDGGDALTLDSNGTLTINDNTLTFNDGTLDKTINACNSVLSCLFKINNLGAGSATLNLVDGNLVLGDAAGSNVNISAAPTGARSLVLPDDSGTVCISTNNCSYVPQSRTLTAGTGLTGGGDLTTDRTFTVDQAYNFAWTGLQSWTGTITDTGVLADFNITLGDDANADAVIGLNVDVTSANTGDADLLYAANFSNVTNSDATVTETALRIGSGYDNAIEFEGAINDANEVYLRVADPAADRTYTIPYSSAATDTFCFVTLGNCAGTGSGVTTGGGTVNYVAKFSAGQTIDNSQIFDDGTSVGINTAGPDRRLDILDATNPQIRLTQTDGTNYADFQVDSSGNLTVSLSGDTLTLSDPNLRILETAGSPVQYATIKSVDLVSNQNYSLPATGGSFCILEAANCFGVGGGGIGGAGTLNYIPKFTPDGANLGNSQLYDNATNIGLNTTGPDAKLDVLATTEQLRLTYSDGVNYSSFTTNSSGDLTIAPSGADTAITGNIDISALGAFGSGASVASNQLLTLAHTFTAAGSSYGLKQDITANVSDAGGSGNIYGLYSKITNSNDISGVGYVMYGSYVEASTTTGSKGPLWINGSTVKVSTPAGTTASTTVYGIDLQASFTLAPVTTTRGLNINNFGFAGTPSSYGLYIEDQTGSTSNYEIFLNANAPVIAVENSASTATLNLTNPGAGRLDMDLEGHLAVGASATNTDTSVFILNETIAQNANIYGINLTLSQNGTGANNAYGIYSLANDIFTGDPLGGGRAIFGLYGEARAGVTTVNGTTVAAGVGGKISSPAASTGVFDNGVTFLSQAPTFSGKKPTNQYGLWVENQGVSGITTNYGIYLANQTGATNNYGLYIAGADSADVLLDANNPKIYVDNSASTANLDISNPSSGIANLRLESTAGLDNISSSSILHIGQTNATTINIGNGSSTARTINIAGGSATGADTINIGTGGTGADTINIGSASVASQININSAGTTGGPYVLIDNSSVSSGTGTSISAASLTAGTAFKVYSDTALTSGTLLNVSVNSTVAGGWDSGAISGNVVNFYEGLYSNSGTTTRTGNLLKLQREYLSDIGAPLTISGAVMQITSGCALCFGTVTNTENILSLSQGYGSATGAIIKISNQGSGPDVQINNSAANSVKSFTVSNSAATPVKLLEVRDLTGNSNQFGSLALADAFVSKQSYFGEEFNSFRAGNCSDASFTNTNHLQARGDYGNPATTCTANTGEITISSVAGTSHASNTCTYSSNNATNGFERIASNYNSGTGVACLESLGTNANNTNNNTFNTGNFPQVVMKVRTNVSASTTRYYAGISNIATAKNATVTGDKGVYFSTCSAPTTPTCNTTGWYGVVQDGTNAANVVTCPTTGFGTTNFSYLRIEMRKVTSGTSIEVQFFVDNDVTDGIVESSCGTVTSTTTAMGNTAMSMFLMATTTAAGTANLDVDYFRVWQDDSPSIAVDETTPVAGNSLNSVILSNQTTIAEELTNDTFLAENYKTSDKNLEPGDLVSLDPQKVAYVKKTNNPYDEGVVGVYTPKTGPTTPNSQIVSIGQEGRILVKVSSENGPIQAGDPLTSSSQPGVAIKATSSGTIIGRALEAYDNSDPTAVKTILVTVRIGYWAPPLASLAGNQGQFLTNLTLSKLTITDSLVIADKIVLDKTGKLTVNGEINVFGKIFLAGDITITGKVEAETVLTSEIKIKKPAASSSQTAGTATIVAGTKDIVIETSKVADNSLIFITPTSQTQEQLAVVEKIAKNSFKVSLVNNTTFDISFNWLIVNQEISQNNR